MGNTVPVEQENATNHNGISTTAAKDVQYLLSASENLNIYPDALEYIIYGFIREFVEQNMWIPWVEHKTIPSEIKRILRDYVKCELIVRDGVTVTLAANVYHEYRSILIEKDGRLTVESWDSRQKRGGRLLLRTDHNITIEDNATINVNGKGYKGGYFCESGESYTGKGTKNSITNNGGGGAAGKGYKKSSGYSKCRGAGAGYGTKGKDIDDEQHHTVQGGHVYGDEYIANLYLGSGGGGGFNNGITKNESGGNGGGAIHIQCKGDVIMGRNSIISASGDDSVFGGGGSGGSIKIECNELSVSKIRAKGGMDKDHNAAGYGRIRISTNHKKLEESDWGYANIEPKPWSDITVIGNYAE